MLDTGYSAMARLALHTPTSSVPQSSIGNTHMITLTSAMTMTVLRGLALPSSMLCSWFADESGSSQAEKSCNLSAHCLLMYLAHHKLAQIVICHGCVGQVVTVGRGPVG